MKKLFAIVTLIGIVSLISMAQEAEKAEAVEAKPPETVIDYWKAGGPVMYPLAVCSIALVGLLIELFLVVRRKKMMPEQQIQTLRNYIKAKNVPTAIKFCEKNKFLFAKIIKAGLEQIDKGVEEVRNALTDAATRETIPYNQLIGYLNLIAAISPMLGLLGTVVGIIQAFNAIAFQQALGKPSLLAGGISQALLTTATGLIIGIPAMLAFFFFRYKLQKNISQMEMIIGDMLETLGIIIPKEERPLAAKPAVEEREIPSEVEEIQKIIEEKPVIEKEAKPAVEEKIEEPEVIKEAKVIEEEVIEEKPKEVAPAACPNCGNPLEEGFKFCPNCGTKIPPPSPVCPNCKTELKPGVKFCPECGTKID